MSYEKKEFTRLVFRIPKDVLKKLRRAAFLRNMSMSLYVLQAVIWRLDGENQED